MSGRKCSAVEAALEAKMTTHRHIQIANLMDIASTNRVRYYINAIRASAINNQSAAQYFTSKAIRWESIRARCTVRLYGAG